MEDIRNYLFAISRRFRHSTNLFCTLTDNYDHISERDIRLNYIRPYSDYLSKSIVASISFGEAFIPRNTRSFPRFADASCGDTFCS